MPPHKHSAKKGTNKAANKSGAKGAANANNKNTKKNSRTKVLTQQEIANMETMKKEFDERMEKLLGVIRETNRETTHLNKVIYAINKVNQNLKGAADDDALQEATANMKKAGPAPEQSAAEWESLCEALSAQKNTDIKLHTAGAATLYSVLNTKFSLGTAVHPVRVDKDGILPVKEIELNPINIAVREIFLNEFDKDFAASRHCSVKRHAEPTDMSAWRGADELRVKEQKYTIEAKLLYGSVKDGWSGAPGSWKNVPNSHRANPAAKTMFQPGSVVVLSYGGEPTRIVGVFKEYTEAELRKVDDLKFCLKAHWLQTGLLYDENPERGWVLPAGWTGPKLIPFLKLAE